MKTIKFILVICMFSGNILSQNLQLFETIDSFQEAVKRQCSSSDLKFEDFNGSISRFCNVSSIPSEDQECYTQDQLKSGYTISGKSRTNIIVLPKGTFADNPINLVGPNNTLDTLEINFKPMVNAISLSSWQFTNINSNFEITVYGENNKILGNFTKSSNTKGLYSYHIISDNPIKRIETNGNLLAQGNATIGVLIGELYFGGFSCVTPIVIEDNNFEQLLIDLGFDDKLDGSIDSEKVKLITTLDVSSTDIINLKGLESFTALKEFTCNNTNIVEIDLSNNTNLATVIINNNTQLTSLNLKNRNSTEKTIDNNTLLNIDIRNNISLNCVEVDDVIEAQNNENWLKDEIAVYSTDCAKTLNISEIQNLKNFSIYPNPSLDFVTIGISSSKIKKVELFNLLGKNVLTTTSSKFSIKELANGMYVLKITTIDGAISTKKLVKN